LISSLSPASVNLVNPVEDFTAHLAYIPGSVSLPGVYLLISLSGENAMKYSPFGRST
jgi:hypothetical protein